MSEGSLEAPIRHPIDWENPDFYDMGQIESEMHRGVRHLSWVSTVLQPLRLFSDPVRHGRRGADPGTRFGRSQGLQEGRGRLHLVRHVLPDEVPLCAAA